jgi:FMN phosphatase YigB (HAD superfamily)
MMCVFTTDARPNSKSSGTNVLLLDVDNCLYSENELLLNTGCGIEEQIVKNTHNFGQRYFNLSRNECDKMYHDYGSTVEGLRQILVEGGETSENVNDVLKRFYQEVYEDIDLSSLLLSTKEQTNFTTGYSHGMKKRQFLQDLLSHSRDPKFLVSNSPVHHVLKVLGALGLHEVHFDGIVTPDTVENSKLGYPTKHSPQEYYKTIIEKFDIQSDRITLLDDSLTNLEKAAEIGFHGIRVNGKDERSKLESALSVVMGHGVEEVGQENPSYTFTDTKYLESKNEVDIKAINEMVWERLGQELSSRIEGSSEVRIVDVGAGLLSMLELVMHGGAGKKSLVNLSGVKGTINYIAYESNDKLLATCFDRLQDLGFVEDGVTSSNKDEYIFTREKSEELNVNIRVSLRMSNFLDDEQSCDQYSPHLIIGCCFADLFDPNDLAASFQRFANKYENGSENLGTSDILIYLPITFEGTTQLIPPKPFGAKNGRLIPSDTAAFQLYADSLAKQHGHNLGM